MGFHNFKLYAYYNRNLYKNKNTPLDGECREDSYYRYRLAELWSELMAPALQVASWVRNTPIPGSFCSDNFRSIEWMRYRSRQSYYVR